MIRNTRLWFKEIPDDPLRKNLEFIVDNVGNENLLKFDWKFVTFSTEGAVTNFLVPHGATFIPTDIFSTRDSGNITFNWDQFTDKFLSITTSGAANFRGLVGRYRENFE